MKIKKLIEIGKAAPRFLTHDLWSDVGNGLLSPFPKLTKFVQIIFLSIKRFIDDNMSEKASALTYSTLLTIVPILALVLGIAKGFGLYEILQHSLYDMLPAQKDTVDYLVTFAEKYLEQTRTGLVLGIGIVMLFTIVINLLSNIEKSFNQIWQLKKQRAPIRKFTDYTTLMIVTPIFVVCTSGIQIFFKSFFESGILWFEVQKWLVELINWLPWLFSILLFTMIYIVIPNTKVKFTSALIAGSVAGLGFEIFQMIYINGLIWVSKYNAIYGSFAAIPLLLLYVHSIWTITLLGAELSFAVQNRSDHEFKFESEHISDENLSFLSLLVAGVVYNHFKTKRDGEKSPTTEDIKSTLKLPAKLATRIIDRLAELDIISETVVHGKEDHHGWVPGHDISTYTIANLLDKLYTTNYKDADESEIQDIKLAHNYAATYADEWALFVAMKKAATSASQDALVANISPSDNLLLTTK